MKTSLRVSVVLGLLAALGTGIAHAKLPAPNLTDEQKAEIGRASCRERV